MAKGKRSSGKHYQSKGERPNISRSIQKATRLDYVGSDLYWNNKVRAWRAGKNVMLTIPNPDKKNTKERMIRVPAIDVWGFPRGSTLRMR